MPDFFLPFLAGLLCGVLLTVVYAACIAGGVADHPHAPWPRGGRQ